jgi:hypothetical protein
MNTETLNTSAAPALPRLLLPGEAEILASFERDIEENLAAAVKVAFALKGIKDRRLYREHYDNFDDYCQARWKMRADSVYGTIRDGQLWRTLGFPEPGQNGADVVPVPQQLPPLSVLRPLGGLRTSDEAETEELQRQAYAEASKRAAGGVPTREQVKIVVREFKERLGLKSNVQSSTSNVETPPPAPGEGTTIAKAPVVVDVRTVGGRVEELGLKLDEARKLVRELADMPGAPKEVKEALCSLEDAGKTVASVERQLTTKDAALQSRCDETIRRIKRNRERAVLSASNAGVAA